jgi:hypothetical protein
MGYWKNIATDREEAERIAKLVLAGDCPECGGTGSVLVEDDELGPMYVGCQTCWWLDEERRLAQSQEDELAAHSFDAEGVRGE